MTLKVSDPSTPPFIIPSPEISFRRASRPKVGRAFFFLYFSITASPRPLAEGRRGFST
jgi:hypothetical protein